MFTGMPEAISSPNDTEDIITRTSNKILYSFRYRHRYHSCLLRYNRYVRLTYKINGRTMSTFNQEDMLDMLFGQLYVL